MKKKEKIQSYLTDAMFIKEILDKSDYEFIGSKKFDDEEELFVYRTDKNCLFSVLKDDESRIMFFLSPQQMRSSVFEIYLKIIEKYNEIIDLEEYTEQGKQSIKKFQSL